MCVCVLHAYIFVWCVRSGLAWLPHLYAKHTQKHSLVAVHCALSLSFFSMFALRERKPVNVCTSVRVTLRFQANSMKRNWLQQQQQPHLTSLALLCFRSPPSVRVSVCVRWQSLSQAAVRVLLLRQYRNFLWQVWLHALAVVRSRRYHRRRHRRRRRGRRFAYVSCVWLCLEARRQHQLPQAAQFQHCGIIKTIKV